MGRVVRLWPVLRESNQVSLRPVPSRPVPYTSLNAHQQNFIFTFQHNTKLWKLFLTSHIVTFFSSPSVTPGNGRERIYEKVCYKWQLLRLIESNHIKSAIYIIVNSLPCKMQALCRKVTARVLSQDGPSFKQRANLWRVISAPLSMYLAEKLEERNWRRFFEGQQTSKTIMRLENFILYFCSLNISK